MTDQQSTARDRRSPLLVAADQAQRTTSWWLTLLVFFVVFLVGSLAAVVTLELPDNAGPPLEALFFVIPAMIISYGLRILVIWGWVRRYERRPFRAIGFPKGGVRRALLGFAFGMGAMLLVVAAMAVAGGVAVRDARPGFTGLAALGGVLIMLIGWTVQGTAEEIMYRGFLLQLLGRYSVPVAIAVSSSLFLIGHQSALGNTVAMLNLLLAGVFFCLYALREGGLWGPSGFHVAWNFTQGTVLGVLVSGKEAPGGSFDRPADPGQRPRRRRRFGP